MMRNRLTFLTRIFMTEREIAPGGHPNLKDTELRRISLMLSKSSLVKVVIDLMVTGRKNGTPYFVGVPKSHKRSHQL